MADTYRPRTQIGYEPRALPDADDIQARVARLTAWAQDYIVKSVQALKASSRPIFTRAATKKELIQQLLSAPEGFWTALEQLDPETATAFVATVLKARQAGQIPSMGPQFSQAEEQAQLAQEKQEQEEIQRMQTAPLESRAMRFAMKPSNVE